VGTCKLLEVKKVPGIRDKNLRFIHNLIQYILYFFDGLLQKLRKYSMIMDFLIIL